MSNDSTNKVDPVIKCFFVSFCTVMAVAFISSFSIKFLLLVFVLTGPTLIPLNTLFIYVISRIRLFRWSLHSVRYVIFETLLLVSHMCLYDRITLMYFPKLRSNTLCDISVFVTVQLVFVFVVSICRNKKIKNKQKDVWYWPWYCNHPHLIEYLHRHWPKTIIELRGDSHLSRYWHQKAYFSSNGIECWEGTNKALMNYTG